MMRMSVAAVLLLVLSPVVLGQAPSTRPEHITFEYAVFWPEEPRNPPVKILTEIGEKRHPALRFVDPEETAPDDIAVYAEVRSTGEYALPDFEHLKKWGRGIRSRTFPRLKKSPKVLVVRTSCPRARAGEALQTVARLIEYIARRNKAWVWDAATRELFTAGQWKKLRLTGWLEGYPRVDRECVVDVTVDDGVHRAVSRGMVKFGQPDVAVAAFARVHTDVARRLVLLACQSLVESGGPWPKGSIKLDIDRLEHLEIRDVLLESLGANAHRKAIIGAGLTSRLPTDPQNGILELRFEGAPGTPLPERQEALFTHVFGEPKRARGKPTPREAEKIASKVARRRAFKEIKPKYRTGVPEGETLLVKIPFENTKRLTEYLWIEVERWDVSRIHGVLMNTPRDIPNMKEGQKVSVPDAKLFDYKWYKANGSVEGNETERARDNKKK